MEPWKGVLSFFSFEITPLLGIDSLSLFWDSQESRRSLRMFPPVCWAISTFYPVEQGSSPDLQGGRGQRAELEGGLGWMGYGEAMAPGPVANSLQDSGGKCTSQWWLMSPTDETSIFRKWQNILGNFSGPSGIPIKNAYIITFFVSFFNHHPREKGILDFLRFWKETFTVYFVGLPRVWY